MEVERLAGCCCHCLDLQRSQDDDSCAKSQDDDADNGHFTVNNLIQVAKD